MVRLVNHIKLKLCNKNLLSLRDVLNLNSIFMMIGNINFRKKFSKFYLVHSLFLHK